VILMSSSLFTPVGVAYAGTSEGFPANNSAVSVPGIIVGIDDYVIRDLNELDAALMIIGPHKTINLKTMILDEEGNLINQSYILQTVCDPEDETCEDGYIGILFYPSNANVRELNAGLDSFAGAIEFIMGLFAFVFIINFLIGAFNLLPLGPLDGGRMYRIALEKITPRYANSIMRVLSYFILALILISFILPFMNMMV